jgi:hypothetical protein
MIRVDAASIPFWGISFYLLTSMFYVWSSGLPQPGDFLLLISIAAALLWSWSQIPDEPLLYFILGLLLAWITAVNLIWFLTLGDYTFVRKTTFYYFNIIVILFVVVIGFHNYQELRRFVRWSCILAIGIQLLYVQLMSGWMSGRDTGTFNNPNQLAYWALLILACLAVAKDRDPLGFPDILAMLAAIYFPLLAASRAGVVSVALIIMIIAATRRWHLSTAAMGGAVVALGLLVEITMGGVAGRVSSIESISSSASMLAHRIENTEKEGLHSLLRRGYDRIITYPEYLVLGAGEGGFERTSASGKEIHSSLGTLLFSYGVVGTGLFATTLLVVFRNAPLRNWLYMAPILIFGVTHQGLRFSEFWIFLGLVYAQARYSAREVSTATSTAPGRT